LKIIPVLDILKSTAVHAVRGERDRYQPLRSILCTSTDPVNVALAFKSFGFDELYIADLDAILSDSPNFNLYRQIKAKTDLDLMIDAGINTVERARKILEAEASNIVIGTETLSNLNFVREAIRRFGEDHVIVSVDLREGRILSRSEALRSSDPASLTETLEEMGVTKVLILDLARVGTERGVNFRVIREVLERTGIDVLTGGGIQSIDDLEKLREIGVSAALIATALHKGKITVEKLRIGGFL
jgi:phosphoribosylformimino-5-aminoimidazole carboxamide ribotide isomerase